MQERGQVASMDNHMLGRAGTIISFVLLISTSACVSTPDAISAPRESGFSLALTRTTDQQKFIVAIHPLMEPIAINKIHSWRIKLTTATGQAVEKAIFYVGGGMPDHGHGFPTRPRVTEQTVAGEYLLEGMKFSMQGRWEIKLGIQVGELFDLVTFNTMVSFPVTGIQP